MGLLDDLLGGLAGQSRGSRAPQQPTRDSDALTNSLADLARRLGVS